VIRGARLIWNSLPKKTRLLYSSLFASWANCSWIAALSTYRSIANSHKADLIFCGGTLFGLSLMCTFYWFNIRPAIQESLREGAREREEVIARDYVDVPARREVVRSGFGSTWRARKR
jgi:hypothetical protein